MYSFSYLEPVCCSMSISNCCFLTCIQVSQEAGQVVWYSHLFQNFPHYQTIKVLHLAPENSHIWPPPLATWSKSLLFFSVVPTIVTAKTWIKRFTQVCDQKYFPGKSGHEWSAPMSKLRVDLLSSLSRSQKKKKKRGTTLMVQWLRFPAPIVGDQGSIPS